jgi:DNA polymerase III epsilon subunit family exonuclease
MPTNELKQLRDKAYRYLLEADRPVQTHVVARRLFGAQRHEMPEAQVVVRMLLEGDPRFLKTHDQRWCARWAPHLQQKYADATFAVVDLETTGSVIGVDQIMDIGIVTLRRGRIGRRLATRLRTDRAIPPWVSRLTGLKEADLSHAPSLDQVAPQVVEILTGTVFVAHDIRFDLPFLRWEIMRRNLNFPEVQGLCTLCLSRALWPDLPSHSLPELASRLGVGHDNPHRAEDDALASAGVLRLALQEARRLGRTTLGELFELDAPAAAVNAAEAGKLRSAPD